MQLARSFTTMLVLLLAFASFISASPNTTVGLNTTGASVITLNSTSMSLGGYGFVRSGVISFNLSLVSGVSGNTDVNVRNLAGLYSNGIVITTIGNVSGNPPFFGRMGIQVANFTPPGNYNVTVYAAGADPSTNKTIILHVPMWIANVSPTSSGSVQTVPSQPGSSSSTGSYLEILVIVVIAAIIFLYMRRSTSA